MLEALSQLYLGQETWECLVGFPTLLQSYTLAMVQHSSIALPVFPRGYHLITPLILKALPVLPEQGILQLFIQHTSAALTINENADPSVRVDFERVMNHLLPENLPFLSHTIEGPDDMPAHVKAALIGTHVCVPIVNGNLALGTWQGIYLCEFRNHGGPRSLVASIIT